MALLPLLFTPVTKARTPEMPVLENRAAQGDITAPGGARRLTGDQTAALRDSLSDKPAKNIILLIGDGMGDSEITAARNYAEGAGGFFKGIDALPLTGQYTHYALNKKTGKPDYVTDSAASATAWSTGVKTYNGALGVDIHEKDHPTILEMAKAAGLATGNVSTAELQGATPAALVAHVTSRKCYGPSATSEKCPGNALEKGGKGSITEQLLNARADVTLGGGAKTFAETATAGEWQGKTLREQAQARGYQLVSDAASLNSVTEANQQKPLLGLFADGNMLVRWLGPKATYHGNIDKPAVTCTPNPQRNDSVPTLAQMTDKAIELLSKNEKGFFLQVEGASIDKQNHAANPCGQIGETVDLDEAVQRALEFAKKAGNTLVIVTADHAHASQIVAPDTKAPGLTQALNAKDGAVMVMSYGNSEEDSQEHTGSQLRIAAYGPHAANVVGLTDQTDLFYTMKAALGLKGSGPPTPTPTSGPAGCQVLWGVNQWNTGFTANVTVKNTSSAPVDGWTLTFSFPSGQQVTQAWSSTVTQSGSAVTVRNAPWNGSIPAGGTAQFGFNGSHTGTTAAPTAFSLNGTPCTVG
nr:alkaline phosphatase / CBM2a fusion protein [Synthetic phage]